MGRIYRVTFDNVLVSAAQDLVQINGASGKMVRILHRWVAATDTSIPSAQMLQLRERFLPSTVTNGTTGTTSATVAKTDPGDAAASFTAQTNCTGKATTNGTAIQLFATGCHIYNGYDDEPIAPYPIGPSEAYVFELESTVTGIVHLSGGVIVEEIGG